MNRQNFDPVVIATAVRTPIGSFQGALSSISAPNLGAAAIKAVVARAGISPEQVSEVLMGCVLTAGLGQAPARQAALGAGLPVGIPCTTVGKVCGSGMKAAMIAHDAILAGSAEIVVAGGMECMSAAPYLIQKARGGYRLGHGTLVDSMMFDGLEDAYHIGRTMGSFGEQCVEKFGFTREAQDAFAAESVRRAKAAIAGGLFVAETEPVTVTTRSGNLVVDTDEEPTRINIEKIPRLKPAFQTNGTITAASSSSISDGAAALLVMRESQAMRLHLRPLARIIGHLVHAAEPSWFTTVPIGAIRKLLAKAGWSACEVDLFEINEAFAVVPMAVIHELGIDHVRVNVGGGACALGHPIGASGARIVVSLLHALARTGGRRGVAALCVGGGEATALAVERL